jgi:hypothetical protein
VDKLMDGAAENLMDNPCRPPTSLPTTGYLDFQQQDRFISFPIGRWLDRGVQVMLPARLKLRLPEQPPPRIQSQPAEVASPTTGPIVPTFQPLFCNYQLVTFDHTTELRKSG